MKFNNRQNPKVQTADGQTIWLSRAPAVVFHLIVTVPGNDTMVLMGKRAPAKDEGGKPDENGKWGLTCGYMDWDENGWEACKREMWEECKIDVDKAVNKSRIIYSPPEIGGIPQPWLTMTDPAGDSTQNVCMHYGLILDSDHFFQPEGELDEITEAAWFSVKAMPKPTAFNHDIRVNQFLRHVLD